MSAAGPPPTLADYLRAGRDGIVGVDETLDPREGSGYDLMVGSGALIWSRQAQRDRDLFRQVYPDTSSGEDLERLGQYYYGETPALATFGTGEALIARPSAAAGAGTIWAGTRIQVLPVDRRGSLTEFAVLADKPISASALSVTVPVRATRRGSGTQMALAAPARLRFGDSVFDATLAPQALTCGEGTDPEQRGPFLARAREARRAARRGYSPRIIDACKSAGAVYVVPLSSDTFGAGADFGINYLYVGDSGYQSSSSLIASCALAIESVRVAGCDIQVLGMTPTPVALSATVRLWRDLGDVDVTGLRTLLVRALTDEFAGRTEFWLFRHAALGGAMQRASSEVERAEIETTPAEPAATFPSVLPRYSLDPNAIELDFVGPT